nr:MAG TPA: hypothetical protein [Caudoviricetes sp.]
MNSKILASISLDILLFWRYFSPTPRMSHSNDISGNATINFVKTSSVIPVFASKVPRDTPIFM